MPKRLGGCPCCGSGGGRTQGCGGGGRERGGGRWGGGRGARRRSRRAPADGPRGAALRVGRAARLLAAGSVGGPSRMRLRTPLQTLSTPPPAPSPPPPPRRVLVPRRLLARPRDSSACPHPPAMAARRSRVGRGCRSGGGGGRRGCGPADGVACRRGAPVPAARGVGLAGSPPHPGPCVHVVGRIVVGGWVAAAATDGLPGTWRLWFSPFWMRGCG